MTQLIFPEDRTPKEWLRAPEPFESASLAARAAGVALIIGIAGGILICIAAFAIAWAVYP